MKKMISAMLAVLLCMSLSVCAFAAPDMDYVIDELDYLYAEELEALNKLAGEVYDQGYGAWERNKRWQRGHADHAFCWWRWPARF